jgi:ribosomal protein S6
MFRYEALILTIPEITKDEAATLEFQIDKLVTKFKGTVLSFERWGKYRLAYKVRRNEYGVYFLVRFEVEDNTTIVNDLHTLFVVKFSDIVMRDLISHLDPRKLLEYQKPPSLEDTPKRTMNSFMEDKGGYKKGGRGGSDEESEDSDFDAEEFESASRAPKIDRTKESHGSEVDTTKEA